MLSPARLIRALGCFRCTKKKSFRDFMGMQKINELTLVAILTLNLIGVPAFGYGSQVKSSQTTGIDEFIAKRINVSEDKTVFTLFALLNVAGYDEENNKQGMHPIRIRMRARLSDMTPELLRERLRSFYQRHPLNIYVYGVVAKLTSGPPDFTFTKEWKDVENTQPFSQLKDLPELLREFHRVVPVDAIYQDVRGEYLSYINDYRKSIASEVAKVVSYCRVKSVNELTGGGEKKYAFIIPNLLQSYENNFSFALDAGFYSVDGPQKQPGEGYNPHEFVHSITNPMSYNPRYRKHQQRAQPLFDAARETPSIQKGYKAIETFFDECLVRAISLKYLDAGDARRAAALRGIMMQEYKSGYVLERFFYEQLEEYEKSKKTLREYYPQMLKRLDVEKELARWRQDGKP
jgi:hypothetical protein